MIGLRWNEIRVSYRFGGAWRNLVNFSSDVSTRSPLWDYCYIVYHE